jgi:hypothetical protein
MQFFFGSFVVFVAIFVVVGVIFIPAYLVFCKEVAKMASTEGATIGMSNTGNNTIVLSSRQTPTVAVIVTGDNAGVMGTPLWPFYTAAKNYRGMIITAAVTVWDASGQIIDGGTYGGAVYLKDETGWGNTRGWNNPISLDKPVEKDGGFHTYYVDFSRVRQDLKICQFSIELTEGPKPGTTEMWFFREVRFVREMFE